MKSVIYMCVVAISIFLVHYHAYALDPQCTIASKTAGANQSVSLDMQFTAGTTAVSSFNGDITFDAAKLVLNSVTIGAAGTSAGKQVVTNVSAPGVVKVLVYGLNNTTISSGVLLTASFTVKSGVSSGSASVSCTSLVASSPTAVQVPVTAVAGTITIDADAPVITITAPTNNKAFGVASISVDGTINDATISSVVINGTSVAVTAGAFHHTMTLTEGNTTISIAATDTAGNVGTSSVVVQYHQGDANEDGVISSADVTVLREQILGLKAVTVPADSNCDGKVNVLDLQMIVNKL